MKDRHQRALPLIFCVWIRVAECAENDRLFSLHRLCRAGILMVYSGQVQRTVNREVGIVRFQRLALRSRFA